MDKDTRNLLFNTTQAIRRLLEEEFSLQLEGTFDVHADGRIADQPGSQLSAAERLVRCRIVEAIQHRLAVGESAAEAVRGFQSEAVFTFLNRLAALKMMEARALVLPCVSQSDQSQGFKEFSGLAPGLIELPDKGYRLYLECLFDEIGREVGVLFDRTDAASQLWPRRKALEAALAKLNTPELSGVWAEDETIGWIYQYYNDPDERKQMREESSAPRNSRELAVRNQFFTPRYVVEFLTDNTLGRIWYEMTKGQTRLKDQCRYLVRRPTEIFLGPASEVSGQHQGAASAKDSASTLNPDAEPCTLSQEDLLRQPVHIPHRPLKDPREIRMIDPACGSMHFGLYAFDLFSVIYEEAWEMAHGMDAATKSDGSFTPFVTFVASFADKAAFLREVPRLIVEHNIHGIDIDPRAAQIAGLALWLRAQRGWQALGLKSSDRPPVRRSNVVCAEPMPGERGLLREFVDRQFPQGERSLFQSFLENVWDKMRLAGEAGSLLKIEEEIRSAIEDARDAWQKLATKPLELFTSTELNQLSTAPELIGLEQAVSSLTTDPRPLTTDFWERIEERIYAALRDYAEQTENGGGFQRRLFAEDAARGFAFIDVCRKRYDVALMNPPFGDPPRGIIDVLDRSYTDGKWDLATAFVTRATQLCEKGSSVGVISTRIPLFTISFESWRKNLFVENGNLLLMADLGGGILDGAMVETAAYCVGVGRRDAETVFIPVYSSEAGNGSLTARETWIVDRVASFEAIPGFPLAYWLPREFLNLFQKHQPFEPRYGRVCQGLGTTDDFRFCRVRFEVPATLLGVYSAKGHADSGQWIPYVKGENFAPYYDDYPLTVNWRYKGIEVKEFNRMRYGSASRNVKSEDAYGRSGLVFPRRTRRFVPRFYPEGMIFSVGGQSMLPDLNQLLILGFSGTSIAATLVKAMLGRVDIDPQFEVGVIKRLPIPDLTPCAEQIVSAVRKAVISTCHALQFDETAATFRFPLHAFEGACVRTTAQGLREFLASEKVTMLEAHGDIEIVVARQLRLSESASRYALTDFDLNRDSLWESNEQVVEISLISYLFGTAFGRWDIRYATGEQAAPELPDPFAPLPVCPPGQLQNAQGLPARPEDVPAAYPVRIPWDGILVDDPNHPLDLERRVREVIEIIWSGKEGGPTAEAIEHEACEILGVKSLRDYFRKPAGFFAEHLKRYSKSRRQAPIYWPLSSPNGLYTVWLYYHRLTPDTLFTVLRDHVKPKLEYEERQAFQLRQEAGTTPSTSQRRDIAEAEELVGDLRAFKAELDRVAPLFRPDLNDGVIINHAPLWRMIGLPKWRKDCQATWNELVKGDYDWAHLALHLWPERVIRKCATDRSLAIAHGLDAIFWREDPEKPGKWISRKVTDLELRGLIAERTSAAVKAAVESLVGATSNEGAPRRGRKGAKA
jgi:hypothetical protein